ncbi:hypothetical protein ABUP57_00200 [Acinetobacter baumannii]|nr:hypothetical protein [Acinetobacter baumannii]
MKKIILLMVSVFVIGVIFALDLKDLNQVQIVRAAKVQCYFDKCPEIAVTKRNGNEYYTIFFNNQPSKILKATFQIDGRIATVYRKKPDVNDTTFIEGRANGLSGEILKGRDVRLTLLLEDSTKHNFTVKSESKTSNFFDELKNNYKRI